MICPFLRSLQTSFLWVYCTFFRFYHGTHFNILVPCSNLCRSFVVYLYGILSRSSMPFLSLLSDFVEVGLVPKGVGVCATYSGTLRLRRLSSVGNSQTEFSCLRAVGFLSACNQYLSPFDIDRGAPVDKLTTSHSC